MIKYFFFLAVLFLLGLKVSYHDETAMDQCMKTHSYDTCFQILNR